MTHNALKPNHIYIAAETCVLVTDADCQAMWVSGIGDNRAPQSHYRQDASELIDVGPIDSLFDDLERAIVECHNAGLYTKT